MDNYRISRVETRDIENIKSIEVASGLSPWTMAGYESELRRRDALILKASAGEHSIIGFIAGRLPLGDNGEAEILNIATAPEFRRQGIGAKLLESFRFECLRRRASGIWLEVRESNEEAIKFYRMNGFCSRGRRPNFYSFPTEDAELMFLPLDRTAVLPKS